MSDNKDQVENETAAQDEILELDETAQPEEWQGELPPEDDFHDQDEFHDDLQEEIVEESLATEAYDDQGGDTEKNKRGKVVFFGILVMGAALMGGLAYLQFGVSSHNGTSNPLIPVSAVMDVNAIQNPVAHKDVKTQDQAATTTAETDLNKLIPQVGDDAGAKVLPSPEVKDISAKKPEVNVSSDVVSSSQNEPAPVGETVKPEAGTVAGVAKIENIPFPAQDTAKEPVKSAPVEVPDPKLEQQIKEQKDQIAALQKSLDEATQRNASLTSEVDDLHKAEAQWGQEKAKLQAQLTAKPAVTESIAVRETTASEKAAPVVKKARTVKKKAAAKTAAPKWILRAATPSAAWVATDANSNELRQVKPGETLPGLGKIKAIRQAGSQWEVVGSIATLR